MDFFPTQYSTLSSVALKRMVEELYGLKEITCKYLLRGVSDTYILSNSSGMYILKIYRNSHRTLNEIKGEIQLLNILKSKGAKVAAPIMNLKGEEFIDFKAPEGLRYGVLFYYAEGRSVRSLNNNQLETLGREMAIVHNITSVVELSYERKVIDLYTTIIKPLTVIESAFVNQPESFIYLRDVALKVVEKINSFNIDKFSYGYCHYDFNPKNYHFNSDEDIMFFDFDLVGKGCLINDIMSFWIYLFFDFANKRFPEKPQSDFEIFLNAYQKIRAVSKEEIEALPYFGFGFWVFQLGFCIDNFDDFSNTFFCEDFLNHRMILFRDLINNHFEFNEVIK